MDWTLIDRLLDLALEEDVGSGDVTTLATVTPERRGEGRFLAKERGVLAGLAVAERVFARVDPSVRISWSAADGDAVEAQTVFGAAEGPAQALLTGERLALNVLQRMSGIATATRRMAEAARPAALLDTRKTAPGLRALDKWAVRLGGGRNHRTGLYDMILVKDNHIEAAGGVREAVEAAKRYRQQHAPALAIEVEARTLEEVDAVLRTGGADWVLLDNMVRLHDDGFVDTSRLREAVALVGGRLMTEASGNVTEATVSAIASTGVDAISAGALTHSVRALDLSMKVALR
jgi:nicotinate-nucleotide pyrophosphorylase (carboxylating)